MNNIFFIGMMGSGKTTTAKEFAKLRGLKAVDLDQLIEEEAHQSINEIFEKHGESAFREFEKTVLKRVAGNRNQVVATGGGIVLLADNIELMRSAGTVIYLKTAFSVLWDRVKHSKSRPLLKASSPQEVFRSLFDARTPLYEVTAHHSVVTDYKTPREVANEINKILF